MAGLCEGGNEPSGSLKAICKSFLEAPGVKVLAVSEKCKRVMCANEDLEKLKYIHEVLKAFMLEGKRVWHTARKKSQSGCKKCLKWGMAAAFVSMLKRRKSEVYRCCKEKESEVWSARKKKDVSVPMGIPGKKMFLQPSSDTIRHLGNGLCPRGIDGGPCEVAFDMCLGDVCIWAIARPWEPSLRTSRRTVMVLEEDPDAVRNSCVMVAVDD
ncbi:hypothetical protein ANN_02860 [Periplaneta americana]|uniref:Uncharacterized protein n=1 Tax=Periplaneta americana TaxID=6978 RepID=A0ABQ8TZX2_PERAM|nr:hypothetical protein ANN_02860 [Periplaneta americana]